MPEAAIHKQSDSFAPENEIRLSEELLISAPTSDSRCPKQRDHAQFRIFVALPLDCRHDGAALFGGKDVRACHNRLIASVSLTQFDLKCEKLVQELVSRESPRITVIANSPVWLL